MILGGLQPISVIDYPGKVAAVVFTTGCNLRCHYCHNPQLSSPNARLTTADFLTFLAARRGRLEAVTVTGGEPTVQPDLLEFLADIKRLGFLVKLDTNGTNPSVVERAIDRRLVDYVAMDVKAPLARYREVAGRVVDGAAVRASVALIMERAPDYEFRTTVVHGQLAAEDIVAIGMQIQGARRHYLQRFVPADSLNDPAFRDRRGPTDLEIDHMRQAIAGYVDSAFIRGWM